jgi:hypothetical protein
MDSETQHRVLGLIGDIFKATDELQRAFPGRPFTPDGHLVGSIGEVVAAFLYDLELLPPNRANHDAITRDHPPRHVQIKLTGGKRSIGLSGSPDYLVVLQLVDRTGFEEVYSGPGAPVWALAPVNKGRQRFIGLSKLRKLQEAVPETERVARVSGRTIGAEVVAEIAEGLEPSPDAGAEIGAVTAQTPIVAAWMAFADKLGQAAFDICGTASIPPEENSNSHPKVLGLLLLSRTVVHLRSALLLLRERQIVDARILARCCIENQFWVAGLIADGPGFQQAMIDDEMRHRRMRGENLLRMGVALEDEAERKLRQFLHDTKQWAEAKTLNPKAVAAGTTISQAYTFYSELSADSGHPSISSLNRHYKVEPDNARLIDVAPAADVDEIAETYHLLCYGMLGTIVGVNQLLGGTPAGTGLPALADEYRALMKAMSDGRATGDQQGL